MSKYEFDGDKVKKLYGAMQKLGYQQSLGEFEKGFYGKDNYQKRKAVYDAMTEAGADLGSSYEDFIGRMRATSSSGGVGKSATKPTNNAAETKTFEMPWEKKDKKAKRADAILHGGGGAFLRDQEVSADEGYRLFSSKLVPERVEDPKSKRLITKPKKYRVPESDVREGGSMVRMVDAYKTVDGRAVPVPSGITVPRSDEDDDFATEYIAGKIDRKEYKKKAKAKDNEAAIANSQPTMEGDEEFLYRTDKRYREYRDKILNGDGDVDELSPETKAWYLERVEARIKDAEERQKKYLSIINSDEHQKKLEENNTDFWRNFSQARGGIGAIGREQAKAMLRETDYTEEMDLANAGLGATESELTDLHALRDMLKGKDVGFFRRFKDFFGNRNNLTFGYQDFADNAALIANKNSKNPLVSSAAESKAKEAEAATMYSRSANLRAKGGDVTAQMVPLVIEIAASGGLSSAASKSVRGLVYAGGKYLMKSAFKKGVERSLMKSLGAGAIRWGIRGIEWVAGATAAGAVVATTTGAGETAANITGRMVGQGAKQEDGSYAFEGGEGAVGAVLHGFTSQLVENATEFMGGGLGYGVGKVASKLTKPLAKVGLGGVTNFFGRIAASPISKATSKTLSKFQIQGIPEEIGEEYLGWAGHSMAGDGDAEWSDFADFQKHKELWATMALSVGAMGAFAASGHIPSLLKRRGRSLKMADRAAAGAFSDEEKWNALRDKLDGTDNNNVLRSLYDNVMQDKSLNGRERKAAMLYAGNLLAYRGANLGAIAGKRLALEQKRSDAEDARRAAMVEGAASDDAERIDEHELDGDDVVSSAFRQGYEETSAANAYLWAKTLEEQEGHAMEVLGLTEKELHEKFSPQNAGETLNEMRKAPDGTYTEEQKKAAFDYVNTRAAYEGVVERTKDDIDSEIAYRYAIVDRQTNVDFGRLHPVKLFTSEKNKWDDAFLVSGRLAFEYNDKGESVVSTRLSDPTLIVSDAAGRTRMVSPSEFADAEDAIDVDEYKNTLAEHIRQEMEERKYAEMLKAAEEAQANEVGEGEQEAPAVEGVSTGEEEHNTLAPSESGGQPDVFGDAFNVGDLFTTEDGEFEVVQLTEGEAPIVQNVETGQQYRPNSEEELRAAILSYIPAFIDGKENTNRIIGYWRVSQSPIAPRNEAQEDSQQEQEEVAPKPNEAQQEGETTSENESVDEEQEVAPEGRDAQELETQQGRRLSEKEARRLLSVMEERIDNTAKIPDVVVNVDGILHKIKLLAQGGGAISYIVSAEPGRRSQVAGMRGYSSVGFLNEEGRQLVLDILSKYPIEQINGRLSGFETSEGETEDSQQEDLDSLVGRSLTETEAKELIHQMEDKSEVPPMVELTRENWESLFGKDGKVMTPLFEVKMGEHQFEKMSFSNRKNQLGMVKPTLLSPDVIVQEESGAEHSERNSSYVFVKAFIKEDGSRYYYFTSITVQNGGLEIVISNHEKRVNKISKLLQEGKIAWINEKFSLHPIAQVEGSVPLNDTNKPTATDNQSAWLGINSSESSHREDTETSENEQGNDEDSAEIPPEKVLLSIDKGEIEGITPQMAHDALYNDPDLETEEVDAIVENSRSTAQGNLAKLQKADIKPRKNESVTAFKKRKAAHIDALAHAEELVRFWEEVQEHRRNLGAQAIQEEENAKQQPEAGTSEPSIESTSEQGAEGKTETELSSGSVSTSGRGNEGVSTEEEGAKSSDKNAKPSEKSTEKIREQRVGTSDIVVGQTVYFRGTPWKVESVNPNGKLTITTEISGHVLRHENILPNWVRLEPVEEKQSDKELSHANNTVSEEQGDAKSARENNSEDLNSTESRDKDYADAVARGDFETAERMLAEEAERKGYSLDSPYQGESAFNGKAPSDSGYYENAEERKKAYDEGDYEGDWTLADELVHGVDMGSLVDFRLSDNELKRANDMTRESILNLREVLRRARSGEKNITIKMYRSVPPGVKERKFRNGDWITPSRLYALDNAEIHGGYEGENQEGWNGGYRIIEQEVPIEDVWWDGNDVNEWGYDNGEREAYRNTENNRKTFSVTYDSEGNLIPLSKRFDETNSDARYSKGGEQRVSNENALDGVSPEQIELRDGLVDIMRDAGMDVSVSDAEGQRVLDLARGATIEADAVREAREIERVNAVFNDELDAFSEDNANRIIFSLGRPSEVLRAAGVPDMPMKLYGSKLLKKIKKHGFDKVALRGLPRAVANPIAVFNNRKQEGNRAILTELHTEQGNVLVAINLGKGADVDFNVVSSVFGKGKNGVVEWINKRQFTYVDEEKALNYLHLAAPIAAASDNQKLSLAANIIKGFENPKLSGENLRQQRKKSITEEMQSIKTKAQSDGTFMLAPNGEPTNLTERQWLQVRTDAFKEWFGDWENDPEEASQMKDENGEPKVFYHNTNADFFAFNPLYNGSSTDAGWLGDGFYFYGDPSEGQDYGEKKMSVFLNIREPYYASEEENRSLSEQNDRSASLEFREERESEGYDGVYFNGDLRQETVVFSPTQIKSATDNVGTFDASKEDIREQRVWHGTPHDFDHFDHSKMGTGEGHQAFGWGTYVTQVEGIGRWYADMLNREFGPIRHYAVMTVEQADTIEKELTQLLWQKRALKDEIAVLKGRIKQHTAAADNSRKAAEAASNEAARAFHLHQIDYEMKRVDGLQNEINEKHELIGSIIWLADVYRRELYNYTEENHPALLYSVEIPDDTGTNYIPWRDKLSTDDLSRINAVLQNKEGGVQIEGEPTGEEAYNQLISMLGSDKLASLALSEAGYAGVSYAGAAGYITGKNYVIFKENDAKIIDKVKLFRGQHGEVRGFAVGGRIYLDPKMASDETAIHEYTHLWADALRRVNPAEWENVKGLLRGTPIWEETKRLYPELADDEDALADEVLAQFSGKHGAKRLAEAREKAMSEADGVFDKAKVASVFDNVRQALKRFWKGVADFLGLHFTSAEEVAEKVLSDLLNGVNPNDVIANTKDSIREQRIDNDTREEMQRSVDELRVEVREGYEKAVKDWKYKIKEQWQDSMLALKTLQDELEKKGVKIEEWENAYWAENRMSSMNEEEMKAYTRDYFKPIVAAQMAASKALPQDLTDKLNAMDAHLREFEKMNAEEKQRNAVDNYLMLKHGLERNRVLAMRDAIDAQWENPSEASSVWRAYNEDAGNRENRRLLQEGKRSFEEFLQVDDAIRAHYAGEEYLKNREKDYSGLTSMTTEELTELKDVENAALQLVKEAEDAAGAELSALWHKVNQATRASVEKLYKSGLLTPAAYSQMTTMFQWYVPLRGFAEETSDEVYDYVDQRNGNGMGAVLKGADGRKSKADSPIAHIGSMAERSVVQGNRNLMKQHFYRMVMAHPNDLVSMGEIYLHHNEVTDEWEMMTPTHSPNASPEQIADETRAFEERMQELVRQEPDNYLRLKEHPDVPYRVLGSNLGEHQVLVKVLGRDKLLTVNGDPRVAQAVNGLFNPDAAQSLAGKSVRALNRVLAQMATQSNPEFIFRNMFRDRSYAMKASLVKDGARYWQRLERNWVAGLGQVIGLSKRYENGTLNINNELDKTFQEFMMNGGATGVTRLLNPEDYKGEITDIAKELQRGKYSVVKLTKLMKKYIEFFGSCSELITRFATYRTSREMGRSVARAVWDAKEISTNFNKKGAGNKALRKNDGLLVRTSGELASFFRNYIIFTNANIQGFHNQWQIAKKHPLRFALNFAVRGLFTGFVMTLANRLLVSAFGDDDDRYMDLPESARRSNLCFFVPGLGWVKFPLGFNYRSFYGLGGLMAERVFMPDESYESFMKSARSLVLDMLPISIRDSEQPLWLNLVPSGVRPMAEVAVNEDWSGRPIVNEYINENWPEYRRANNHTSPVSVEISKKSSDWTGGDEYSPGFVNLNPSQFEHIALGLLSGVGTLVGNSFETGSALWHGEELDTQHIPFLRDFLARNNQITHASSVKHNFYALKDEYEKTKVRVKGYEKEEADGKNDPESVARRVDFRKNSKEYKRYEVMDGAVRTENKIRKYMKEATTPEEVKKLEADLQQVMEDAINDVRAIK